MACNRRFEVRRGSRHSLAAALPIQFERAGQLALIPERAQKRLEHRQIQYARGRLAVVVVRRLQVECPGCVDVIGVVQSRAEVIYIHIAIRNRTLSVNLPENQIAHPEIGSGEPQLSARDFLFPFNLRLRLQRPAHSAWRISDPEVAGLRRI